VPKRRRGKNRRNAKDENFAQGFYSVVVLFSFCLFEWNTSRNARLTVEKQISNDGDAINKKKEA